MKQFNFLSKLSEQVVTRLKPLFTHLSASWCFVSVLCLLLTFGAGSAWGAKASFAPSNFTGQGTSGTGSAISATVDGVTFACNKGYGTTQIRCYQYGTITISSSNTITAISFTFSGSYKGGMKASYTDLSTTSWTMYLSEQARITACEVTYTVNSCTTAPTVTAGSNSDVTHNSATVSCSSGISSLGSAGCSISSYGFVIGSSSNPTIGGSGVTKHEVGTSYTTTGTSFSKNLTKLSPSTTYYVRPYATNGKGTAYGIQTSFATESKNCTDKGASSITKTDGNSCDYGPVDSYYKYSTRQILYTKSDLDLGTGKKGTIKSIYFKYKYGTAMTKKTSVDIYMANTDLSSLSASSYVPYSEFTLVYSGSLNCTTTNNWNEFVLDTPFEYNGVGNLVVLIDDNSNDYDGSYYTFYYHAATGAQIFRRGDSDNQNPSTADWTTYSVQNFRPSTKFCVEVQDLPLYTVTYNAGTGTCGTPSWKQTSFGESTTLPSATPPATCTGGWSFAGWCTSSAGDADENSTSPGTILTGSYTPTGDVTLYAVYKRTASGGTTTYTLVDDAGDFGDGTYVVAGLASSTYYFMDGNVTANTGLGVETTGLAAASVSDGSFAASSLPSGAIEIDVEDDGEPDGDNHYYFISYTSGGNTYYMDDSGTKQSLTWTTNTTVYTYHPNFTQNATDGCVLLSSSGAKVSQNGSTKASFIRNYASSGAFYNDIYFFKKSSGTTYYMTSLVCCTALGSINGSVSWNHFLVHLGHWGQIPKNLVIYIMSMFTRRSFSARRTMVFDADE